MKEFSIISKEPGQNAGNKVSDTGRSIANAVGNKATAAKNKVGQVAGDIKNAGALASLRGDLQRAEQQSGLAIEKFIKTFTDLQARAQSLRLDDEEQRIKSELQALKTYQRTASAEANQPQQATVGQSNKSSEVPSPVDMPTGNPAQQSSSQSVMDLPPIGDRRKGGPTATPSPVNMGDQGGGMDWRANQSKPQTSKQTNITPTSPKKPTRQPPRIKTKLDPDNIRQAVKKYGVDGAAKKLGVSKQAMIQALK